MAKNDISLGIHINTMDGVEITTMHVDHSCIPSYDYIRFDLGPASVIMRQEAGRGLVDKLSAYFAAQDGIR